MWVSSGKVGVALNSNSFVDPKSGVDRCLSDGVDRRSGDDVDRCSGNGIGRHQYELSIDIELLIRKASSSSFSYSSTSPNSLSKMEQCFEHVMNSVDRCRLNNTFPLKKSFLLLHSFFNLRRLGV